MRSLGAILYSTRSRPGPCSDVRRILGNVAYHP